jgi:hypothetical protein
MEFFIAGTEPTQQCHLHAGGIRPLSVFRKIWPF